MASPPQEENQNGLQYDHGMFAKVKLPLECRNADRNPVAALIIMIFACLFLWVAAYFLITSGSLIKQFYSVMAFFMPFALIAEWLNNPPVKILIHEMAIDVARLPVFSKKKYKTTTYSLGCALN